MSQLLYLNVGENGAQFYSSQTTAAGNPQLQFFENFPGKNGNANLAYSNGTLSVHLVNLSVSVSFNNVVVLLSQSNTQTRSYTLQFGLYSLNAATLSLANSASANPNFVNAYSWVSMATSAGQNISTGNWYFAFNMISSGNSSASFWGNSSFNVLNAEPVLVRGRMTVSTNNMPASIATSDLDRTGSDASRQPYIIITS